MSNLRVIYIVSIVSRQTFSHDGADALSHALHLATYFARKGKETRNFVHSKAATDSTLTLYRTTKFGNAVALDKSKYVRTRPHNNIHNNDNNINLENTSAFTQVRQPFSLHFAFG